MTSATLKIFTTAILFFGSLTSCVLQEELHPFSHFPMFSGMLRKNHVYTYHLYGLYENNNGDVKKEEIQIQPYLYPLAEHRLVEVLWRTEKAYNISVKEQLSLFHKNYILRLKYYKESLKKNIYSSFELYRKQWNIWDWYYHVNGDVEKTPIKKTLVEDLSELDESI